MWALQIRNVVPVVMWSMDEKLERIWKEIIVARWR
jgi:hypothetical protein